VVSDGVARSVSKLTKKYQKDPDSLYCDDFVSSFFREIFPVVNGCVDPVHMISGLLLHPEINVYSFPVNPNLP